VVDIGSLKFVFLFLFLVGRLGGGRLGVARGVFSFIGLGGGGMDVGFFLLGAKPALSLPLPKPVLDFFWIGVPHLVGLHRDGSFGGLVIDSEHELAAVAAGDCGGRAFGEAPGLFVERYNARALGDRDIALDSDVDGFAMGVVDVEPGVGTLAFFGKNRVV